MRGAFLDFQTVSFHDDVDPAPLQVVLNGLQLWPSTAYSELREHTDGATVLLSNKVRLDGSFIRSSPGLQLICVAATGTDNVDLEAARHRGIAVCNVPAYSTLSVVQQVFALILNLTQHLREYEALLLQGTWRRAPQFTLLDYPIRELAGKQFGILGYGDIGKAVAKVAKAFGMQVKIGARNVEDKRPGRLALEDLLSHVDVLTIHVPLLPETRNLIGSAELALMKPDALLINCARGGIVDEQALADALKVGKLGGAGFDVLSEEPPVHGNPLLTPGIPNLIVTPHIAWAAREARQRVIVEMALNIEAFKKGEKRNRVA
ncbi:MAG: glycerate dehydrogenase [Gammaproteobacteria bacterium]|nr:glycerate dehydrogenase [Gammaproteobacteria bacterium]